MARISALKIVFHHKHRLLEPTFGTITPNIKKGTELRLQDNIADGSSFYIVESLMLKQTDSAYIEIRVKPRS